MRLNVAELMQMVVAFLVLVGGTVLAILGVIQGSDAVSLYAVVLGYAFGVSQGMVAERRNTGQ